MHDGPQLDLSAQVAKVQARARPWRSIIALVLAIAAAAASEWAQRGFRDFFDSAGVPQQLITAGCAVAFFAFASIATYGLSGKARDVLEPRTGAAHAAVVRYALVLIGAFTTLIITLELLRVPVGQLVLGGALTSVFVGIAAQQSLSNVFAGIVLLMARPFRVGDAIRLQAGALGGVLDGTVTEIGITYVRLAVNGSMMAVPNSQVLNAVVGPVPPDTDAGAAPGADMTGTGLAGPAADGPAPASPGVTTAGDPAGPITASDKTPPQG
jgi:small-conductance mechanosensitive channel